VTEDDGMKYTKEYIAKVRLCSNLLDPPASEVIGELLDEIERLTAERDAWKADAERLKEANEDVQSRLDDYRQDYATVVNDQCPTDERHCGCVPILRRENRLLSEDLANTKLELHKYQKALLLIITMPKLSQAITIAINALNETGKYSWSEESVGEYWVNQLSMLQDKYDILEKDYADVCAKRIEAADSFSKEIIELRNINRELQELYEEMTDSLENAKLKAKIAELTNG
jgi:ATP-dependent Lon protease